MRANLEQGFARGGQRLLEEIEGVVIYARSTERNRSWSVRPGIHLRHSSASGCTGATLQRDENQKSAAMNTIIISLFLNLEEIEA